MKLLALDTASDACTAALLIDDQIRSRFELTPRGHSGMILDMIESLLAEAGIARNQIDAIAFGRGPGSFTGVRIAASVTQGIAFALDLPVVSISSLAALAQQAFQDHAQRELYVAIDARMNEVYYGRYRIGDDRLVTALCDDALCAAPALPLPDAAPVFACGSAWAVYRDTLLPRMEQRLSAIEPQCYPHAAAVALLGQRDYRLGLTFPPEQAIPHYLRDKVAEKPKL